MNVDIKTAFATADRWMLTNKRRKSCPNSEKIIWIDIETTGLDPEDDEILEVGVIVTDTIGMYLDHFSSAAFPRNRFSTLRSLRAKTIPVVNEMHTNGGLWSDVLEAQLSKTSTLEVETELEAFLRLHTDEGKKVPMAGSSVDFDRKFLNVAMPGLISEFFTHRVIDMSTLYELMKRTNPPLAAVMYDECVPMVAHRAIPDLVDTINGYRFYLKEFLWTSENAQGIGHKP